MSFHSKKRNSKPAARDIQLNIQTLNAKGEGVGFFRKLKITVEKTLPGEDVSVRFLQDRPPGDRIRLQKILKASPIRIAPPCPYFEHCGGCQLQHLPYSEQLKFKHQWIRQAPSTVAGLRDVHVHEVEPMPVDTRYRNKTQMPYRNRKKQVIYGLYHHGTRDIIDSDYCLVESRDANQALRIVKDWANEYRVAAYSEEENSGVLSHVVVLKGQFTNQVMIGIVSRIKELPHYKDLLERLRNGLPSLKSVILNFNPHRTNTVLGDSSQILWGEPFIEEKLAKIRFRIYPDTFFQTNSVQMIRLIDKMIKVAEFRKDQAVMDLFCGTGTIGLLLADKVRQLVGVDNNESSIRAARENCNQNHIKNAEFRTWQIYSGLSTSGIPAGYSNC